MELILYISKDINIIERLVYITVKTYIKDKKKKHIDEEKVI